MLLLYLGLAAKSADTQLPWVVGADWDDTIVAGGGGRMRSVRGIGKRLHGTYPGMPALLAELDQRDVGSFQIWSANPFHRKRQDSCDPPLHRRPLTRKGSLWAGIGWVIAHAIPRTLPRLRSASIERAARALGTRKYRSFVVAAATTAPRGEVVFFGDSAQGDVDAARRMLAHPKHGDRAWVFLHDLTREANAFPHAPVYYADERIAIKKPFCTRTVCSIEASPRLNYYKTVPEAAFLLAQYGFLDRDSLGKVVEATTTDLDAREFVKDEIAIARLQSQGWNSCPLAELIRQDLEKADALFGYDAFWEAPQTDASRDLLFAKTTAEVPGPADVPLLVRRTAGASERAERAATFKSDRAQQSEKGTFQSPDPEQVAFA